MDKTVLCYIIQNDKYLMLYRNKKKVDINKGKWMGIGGHIEEGETPDEALIREVKEETNLDVISFTLRGRLLFINGDYEEEIYLYDVLSVKGELGECNEGELKYFSKEELFNLNMWEGDYHFLRMMFDNEPYFELTLVYDGDKLLSITKTK